MFLYVYLEKDVGWGKKKKKSKMSLRRKIQSGQHWDRMSESDVIGELWTVSSAVNFRSNVERLSNYSDRLDEKILPTISDVTYDDLNRDLAQVNAKISIRVVGNYSRYKYEISIHKKKIKILPVSETANVRRTFSTATHNFRFHRSLLSRLLRASRESMDVRYRLSNFRN